MSIRQRQSKFTHMVALLILHAEQLGYELTLGDAWAKTGHVRGSFHYQRLAVDLNLFENGHYLTSTEAHKPLGEYWESIGGSWGGKFQRKDGNHYSLGEGK
ncbi:MAG: M15 family metallopeptidase [Candidatus Peribacteraceae bacterium]|nr:M15 family metallopeptidase [Candidatus Peribacteraceae bacterium]